MAEALGLPKDICSRPPTTDTYSLPQSQEEFYFSLPYDKMDLCLYAREHDVSAAEAAPVVGIPEDAVERVFKDIDAKRRATLYLGSPPLTVAELEEADP
jgi:NAD+ synthase